MQHRIVAVSNLLAATCTEQEYSRKPGLSKASWADVRGGPVLAVVLGAYPASVAEFIARTCSAFLAILARKYVWVGHFSS